MQRFNALLARRAAREPIAYILGRRAFRYLTLTVDRRVLIPRPETELLVEVGLGLPAGASVLDVGTGSGAVALALKHERPDLEVAGIDISPDAVAVARANATRLNLDVSFRVGDLLGRRAAGRRAREPALRCRRAPTLVDDVARYEPAGRAAGRCRRAGSDPAPDRRDRRPPPAGGRAGWRWRSAPTRPGRGSVGRAPPATRASASQTDLAGLDRLVIGSAGDDRVRAGGDVRAVHERWRDRGVPGRHGVRAGVRRRQHQRRDQAAVRAQAPAAEQALGSDVLRPGDGSDGAAGARRRGPGRRWRSCCRARSRC